MDEDVDDLIGLLRDALDSPTAPEIQTYLDDDRVKMLLDEIDRLRESRDRWRHSDDDPRPMERKILVVYDGEVWPAELEGRALSLLSARGEYTARWSRVERWAEMPSPPDSH